LTRERCATLAILIGLAGAGCRQSNPAYLPGRGAIDAARERHSTEGVDSPAAVDKASVDTALADLAGPDLGNPDQVTDTRTADASTDQQIDVADAGVDATTGPDVSRDAKDASMTGDAADVPLNPPPGLDGGAGVDGVANVDLGPDVAGADLGVIVGVDVGQDTADGPATDEGTDVAADQAPSIDVPASDVEPIVDAACVEGPDGSSCIDATAADDAATADGPDGGLD